MVVEKEQAPKKLVEIEAQDVEVEERSPERESTVVNPRIETKSLSRSASPLIPPEVHPSISRSDEVSTLKKPSSRVVQNHSESNIIGSLDEGLHLRKGSILIANHVTYPCYLAQFEPKMVEKLFKMRIGWSQCMKN